MKNNPLWINRMHNYSISPPALLSSRNIIELKVKRQNILLRKYKKPEYKYYFFEEFEKININHLLLEEARSAKHFWRYFKILVKHNDFKKRKGGNNDVVNKILDIGYHHLAMKVKLKLEKNNIPPDLALIHKARNLKSRPLAYDLMEMFRSDLVDKEVLKFFRLKKKVFNKVIDKDIRYFLNSINKNLDKKYFIKDFKGCQTYDYYMDIQILKFIKAVNHKEVFVPIHLPVRNEHRCS